jgi:Secretion system C-terminal sorting domain
MKKIYIAKTIFTLVIFTFISLKTYTQVRIVQVNPSTNSIIIHNYGGATVNVTGFWTCTKRVYGALNLMTLLNGGDLMLDPGEDLEFINSINLMASADLGLYDAFNFASSTSMQDYLQWGGVFNGLSGREDVAVAKGIWVAGTIISASPPYQYTGDGTQNGVTFWGTVLGIEDFENNITFKAFPNPTISILNLQLSSGIIDGTVTVFDMLGKQILKNKININNNIVQLDVSNISNGLYLVKVSSEGNTQVKRFIKR